MKCLCQEFVLSDLGIKRAEKPKFVFNDGTSNIKFGVDVRKLARSSTSERDCSGFYIKYKAIRSKIAEDIAMKMDATALRDDVEDTAGSVAEFSAICSGFN